MRVRTARANSSNLCRGLASRPAPAARERAAKPGVEQERLLVDQHGWTLLTAVNLMLFSLLHNPCATTIITIYKETLSRKWATIGALMPLSIAFIVTFVVAVVWRALA